MFSNTESTDLAPPDDRLARRRALARSVTEATNRHVARFDQFVAAARTLATETGSAAFTVQQVVSEAGLSLKSFYALFRGKDDLLCALLEEDTSTGAELLVAEMAGRTGPDERIEAFVRGIIQLASLPQSRGYAAVLVREHHRLSSERPAELGAAMRPMIALLKTEIAALPSTDRSDRAIERTASMMAAFLIAQIAELVLTPETAPSTDDAADAIWTFCRQGIGLTTPPDKGTP